MSGYDDAFNAAFGNSKSEPSAYDRVARDVLDPALKPVKDFMADRPVVGDFSGNLRFATPFGTVDTQIPLPQSVNRSLAEFGSGVDKIKNAFASRDVIDTKREIDKTLLDSGPAKARNFLGQLAPWLALPTVGGPILGGAVAGGLMGFTEPVGTGDSRGFNTAAGAILGAALPAVITGAKAIARPSDAKVALAKSATDEGIPLGIADVTDSRFLKSARSVLNDMPFIGGIGEKQAAATQEGFNRATGARIGADSKKLTPDVMAASKYRIGGELNRIWGNNNLKIDPQYVTDLQRISQDASTKLLPDQAKMVENHIQNLLSNANNAQIPGAFTNNWQSELRMAADGEKGLAKNVLNDLRKSTIAAFNRSVTGQDAATLTKARGQYSAYKAIEPIMNKAEAGVAGRMPGDVPAALLPGRIVEQYGSAGRSPFGDLPQIGSQFLVDRVPRTGGSIRAAIQNTLIGSGLLSGGALGGAMTAGGMGAGAGVAAGAGMAALVEKALGSPALAKSILEPAMQRGLLDPADFSKAMSEIMRNAAYRAPVEMGLLSSHE